MTIARYRNADLYITTELRRQFEALEPLGRARLLRRILRDPNATLPDEIRSLAGADSSPLVRQTLAREAGYLSNETESRLCDGDDYLKACRLERATGLPDASTAFVNMSPIERLAFLRSEAAVRADVVLRVFDRSDPLVPKGEHSQCMFAYLSNPHLRPSKLTARLWEMVAAWTDWEPVARVVFEHLPVSDDQRRATYEASPEPSRRIAIARGCSKFDVATLALAAEDSTSECRQIAKRHGFSSDWKGELSVWQKHRDQKAKLRNGWWRSRTAGFLLKRLNFVGLALTFMVYWNWFIAPAIHGVAIGPAGAFAIAVGVRLLFPTQDLVRPMAFVLDQLMRGSQVLYITMRWLASRPKRRVLLSDAGPTSWEEAKHGSPRAGLPNHWKYSDSIERLSTEFHAFVAEDPHLERPPVPYGSLGDAFVEETVPIAFWFAAAFGLRALAGFLG